MRSPFPLFMCQKWTIQCNLTDTDTDTKTISHASVFCQCLYEKGCIQRPKAPLQDQKDFQALNNYKKILKNKKIFRPTDPILLWHES